MNQLADGPKGHPGLEFKTWGQRAGSFASKARIAHSMGRTYGGGHVSRRSPLSLGTITSMSRTEVVCSDRSINESHSEQGPNVEATASLDGYPFSRRAHLATGQPIGKLMAKAEVSALGLSGSRVRGQCDAPV